MAESEAEICNLAISHLGAGKEIEALDTDRSAEGVACRRFWDTARKTALRDFDWHFNGLYAELSEAAENPGEDEGWNEYDYAYSIPENSLKVRRILSGTRNDDNDTRVKYREILNSAGTAMILVTDQLDAVVEYSIDIDNVALFPEDFVLAMSYKLASLIAPRILGRDPNRMGDSALLKYRIAIAQAGANSLNEQQPDSEPMSALEKARL